MQVMSENPSVMRGVCVSIHMEHYNANHLRTKHTHQALHDKEKSAGKLAATVKKASAEVAKKKADIAKSSLAKALKVKSSKVAKEILAKKPRIVESDDED